MAEKQQFGGHGGKSEPRIKVQVQWAASAQRVEEAVLEGSVHLHRTVSLLLHCKDTGPGGV